MEEHAFIEKLLNDYPSESARVQNELNNLKENLDVPDDGDCFIEELVTKYKTSSERCAAENFKVLSESFHVKETIDHNPNTDGQKRRPLRNFSVTNVWQGFRGKKIFDLTSKTTMHVLHSCSFQKWYSSATYSPTT